jgi:hypothetical protein
VKLKIQKYLRMPMGDPSFTEAFETIIRAAGMSIGATIQSEITFE